jgi:hypothetical protein
MMGRDANGRTVGAPGATYGAADASKLTLGSGCSGNITCSAANTTGPMLIDNNTVPLAGGIILLLAHDVTVGDSGSITATAAQSSRDTSSAGGYVFIRGGTLALGTERVTALGGSAPGQGVNAGTPVTAGDGYIVVEGSTVTGTTNPAAHSL